KLASGIKQPAGPWGTIGNCDTPYWTVVNLLQHISKAHKDIDYIVVSGDLGSHTIWNYTRDANQFVVRNISAAFQQFLPGVKTYFAIGNHEPAPADNVAVHNVPDRFLSDWLYDTMADSWKSWLPSDQLEVVKYRGSFVIQLYPGLRLISHNTLLGDDNNFFLYINQTDPDGYMTWLANELAKAEAAGDKVQIVGHIPPSEGDTFAAWTTNYLNVVNRFEDTIVGQFMGHTHTEQYYLTFEKIDDARTRPTSVIYSSPSVTPYGSCNPAYRIYTVDGNYTGSTYKLLDWEEWFLNLTVANANPSVAEWTNLYSSVRAEYGLKSLEPADWKDLEERMHTDDGLYRKYW
ncbi:CBN-ASM-3 protein, partial [Aphelenchoides avenae]